MKAKHRRLRFVLISLLAVSAGAALVLYAFRDSLVFFYTPSQWQEKRLEAGFDYDRELRIGGLVKEGSVKDRKGGGIRFVVTDLKGDMKVTYQGFVPSLFREGQGVVAQGVVNEKGVMTASSILAKHDENYMPKEVYEELKRSGKWEGGK